MDKIMLSFAATTQVRELEDAEGWRFQEGNSGNPFYQ